MTSNPRLRDVEQHDGAVFPAQTSLENPPLNFGAPPEEYAAATSSAAVFDFSDRELIELTGSNRTAFLHSFCTNDIKGLRPGQGCEAFVTNVKGKIVGHAWIDACENSLWLEVSAGSAERLLPHLERYIINEDVTIADRRNEFGELLVLGPQSGERLADVGLQTGELSRQFDHFTTEFHGRSVRCRRFGVGILPGYVLVTNRDELGELWVRLCDACFRQAGSDVWNALRIEAGIPVFGIDISDDNLAQEAGRTETAISFTKGCYLGQEPIARIDAMGHVNRELRSLRLASQGVPQPGAAIFADPAATKPVGSLTSAAFSFGTRSAVAMALLRSSVTAPGSEVFVSAQKGTIPATVFWPQLD